MGDIVSHFYFPYICSNETIGKMASDIINEGEPKFEYQDLNCKHACSFMNIEAQETTEYNGSSLDKGSVKFKFHSKVKVLRSQYSFPLLTLIAEVGGYVGLFLGVSLLQISDLLDWFSSRFWKSWQKRPLEKRKQFDRGPMWP